VWKVISNREKAGLPAAILGIEGAPAPAAAPAPARFRARAFLKVQDGCDMACAFCVIPAVRGRSVSITPATAVERAGRLAQRGYAEIVLTGIRLCAYGRDLVPRSSLLDLLRAVGNLPGPFAVRLSSLDPRLMPGPLVDLLVSSPKIRPHFHLSLQHAAPRRLEAMGRASTPAGYESLLRRLRQGRPEAALGADVIVGFPGETEAEFAFLADFIEQSPLTYLHVFIYSPRPGTAAAGAPGSVGGSDSASKARRAARLRTIGVRKDLEFRRRFLDSELDGVVIQPAGSGAEVLTANGIAVTVPGRGPVRGEAVRVRITEVADCRTSGKII